jgi:esterase/lipase superfamily enzyme
MKRSYRKQHSPNLGKAMEMLIFGDEGIPVLAFPTAKGRFFEWENQKMTETVREKINPGYNQIYCVDSIMTESLLNRDVDPFTRLMRLQQYEKYIIDEVVPFIKANNNAPFLMTAGCELGGYLALLYLLKHPGIFGKGIAISGQFDIKPFLGGFYNENAYFNNPVDFIPNLYDAKILQAIENTDIRLVTYDGDPQMDSTKRMSHTFQMRHIDHTLEVRNGTGEGRWEIWQSMFNKHIV